MASPLAPAPCVRILIIEDERAAARELAETLAEGGIVAELAFDGEAGLRLARDPSFDVLVIDRMLPGLDGLTLVKTLRSEGVGAPVLFVTAMGSVADRVAGFDGGGDDYLVKPYSTAELKARVQALARRGGRAGAEPVVLTAGHLELNRLTRSARRDGDSIELLPLEFKLLEHLVRNAGRAVTRTMLLEQVWGFHFDPRTNIVETHISRLRRKIDRVGQPSLISTVRGVGYVLAA